MRRRLIFTGAAAALIALATGWYFGSPWWTLWRMREAARAGDVRTLASYVDLETMNRGAAAAARAYWRRSLERIPTTTETARRFIAYVNRRLATADADAPVRLEELRPWLSEIPIAGGSAERGNPYIIHRGLDSFELRYRGASRDTGPLLTFRRHGLGWRLVGVRWGQQ